LELRRYRCPDCRLLLTTRPNNFFSRFQASISDIRDSLSHRLQQGRWKPNLSASRQRHWFKGLLRKIRYHLQLDRRPHERFRTASFSGHLPRGQINLRTPLSLTKPTEECR